jgi:hypothetical protein
VPKHRFALDEYRSKGFPYTDDVDSRWKVLVWKRRIRGLANFVDRAKSEGLDVSGLSYRSQGARVGSSLHACKAHSQGGDDDIDKVRVLPSLDLSYKPDRKRTRLLATSSRSSGSPASLG